MRLLFGLSCVDVILSIILFCSTWPIPSGTPDITWAAGNATTCRLQGFIIQLGSAGFIYNSVLTVYFVLVVRYSMKETALLKYEWIFHAVPLSFGLITSVIGLIFDFYGNSNLWCWIGGFDDAPIFRWAFYYAPLWFCFLVVLIGMIMVFWGVHIQETKSAERDGHRQYLDAVGQSGDMGSSFLLNNGTPQQDISSEELAVSTSGSAQRQLLRPAQSQPQQEQQQDQQQQEQGQRRSQLRLRNAEPGRLGTAAPRRRRPSLPRRLSIGETTRRTRQVAMQALLYSKCMICFSSSHTVRIGVEWTSVLFVRVSTLLSIFVCCKHHHDRDSITTHDLLAHGQPQTHTHSLTCTP